MNTKKLTLLAISLIAIGTYVSQLFGMGAGVLPYKIEGGQTYFLVGYNPLKKAVCDFGGMAENQKDHGNPVNTAAREFNEETMYMFSAGSLPIQNLLQTYQNSLLAIPYHRTVIHAVQNATHRLTRVGPGFNYTMYIVPVWTFPHQASAHDLYPQRQALEQSYHNAWQLGAEPNNFAWISKDDLYNAINTGSHNPVARAPYRGDVNRTFALCPAFAGMLRHGTTENGRMGLQSVMP